MGACGDADAVGSTVWEVTMLEGLLPVNLD